MKIARFGAIGIVVAALGFSAPVLGVGGEDETPVGKNASTFDLDLDLYVGGIPLGKVGMSARMEGKDYKASSTLETRGIVNAFWQAKIETASHGVVGDGRVQPEVYDSFSLNRNSKRQQVKLTFGPDGPKSLYAEPAYPPSDRPVSDEQQKKTLDPLSAMVYLATSTAANEKNPCALVAPIYDGRRRYDVTFNLVKKTNIHMDNGLYSGPAMVCEIRYNQIAGYKQTLVEQGKKVPKVYAWVATLQSPSDPSHSFNVPLRIWAETEFGMVVGVASQVKVDGVPLGKAS